MREVRYPEIVVRLTGEDGNAFFIVERVCRELRRHGVPPEEIIGFKKEAMSGDYSHLLATCSQWVEVY